MTLKWKEEYATGISIIDFDHRQLFGITNILAKSIANGDSAHDIGDTIALLASYIERHFAREESIFREAGYPDFEQHIEKHRSIEKTVRDIERRHKKHPTMIESTELLAFLENWLGQHILRNDFKYVPYVVKLNAEADKSA